MRRLLLTVVALTVSAGAGRADSVILPVLCVPSVTGGEARPGPLTAYKILGKRQHRTYTICARNRGGQCRTLQLHKFDIQCGSARVPIRSIARSIISQRGVAARIAGGRLTFKLGSKPFSALNVLCANDNERSSSDRLAVRRWNLDSECHQRSIVPRDVIELPSGFAPLAVLGGQIVSGYQARTGLLAAINSAGTAGAGTATLAGSRAAAPRVRPRATRPDRPSLPAARRDTVKLASAGRNRPSTAAMALPGEATRDGKSQRPANRDANTEVETKPKPALLPRFASRAIGLPLSAQPTKDDDSGPISSAAASPQPLRVAAAGKVAVTASDAPTWSTIVEAVSNQSSGDVVVRQRMQQSMVATVLGLALVTSLVSGIGWFATQQLLGAKNRVRDPYQVMLRREVADLAKPDAQMCGELCRTGQGLIGEINHRVDEIKGAAPLRRVLLREVRSMEQFLTTTIQEAPDDPKEWRRMRLRLQRVVTDLIRLKDITDGARRSLTTKIISDELPRDKQEAFEVLGANPEASEKILKRLVDALRATWHPDLAISDDDRDLRDRRIKQINVAWDLIIEKRVEA